ncbi:antitoxin [Mycobacterium tuberculosis]|uniref:Antitoxin n=1 Tax=Mycobacterium tuberculosis TaxID=1773 RepID=A0A916PHP6_MYCTX|nr:antitoxin [Mycobacterium tuberculosis]
MLTGQIDRALESIHGTDEAEALAVANAYRVLETMDDEW